MTSSTQISNLFEKSTALDFENSPFQSIRNQSKSFLLQHAQIPNRKMETWRFTPLSSLLSASFETEPKPAQTHTKASKWKTLIHPVSAKIVWNPSSKSFLIQNQEEGISILALKDAPTETSSFSSNAKNQIGTIAPTDHFTALNNIFFSETLFIDIAPNIHLENPLTIIYPEEHSSNIVTFPRIFVRVGKGAQVEIIEAFSSNQDSRSFINHVQEIIVEEGAHVEHTRIHSHHGFLISNQHVEQKKQSQYVSRVFSLGGKLLRHNLHIKLSGEGASCNLEGTYHASSNEVIDHHIFAEHSAPHCNSHQHYRGIVQANGHAVFDGIAKVHRDAQNTAAHQQNKNLLLSDQGTVHTKPHLEIDADDVACSHGATIGSLDEAQLFYLRSRGLEEKDARSLLTWAFVNNLIEMLSYTKVKEELSEFLKQKIDADS